MIEGDTDAAGDASEWDSRLVRGNGATAIPQADVRRATRLIAWGLRPKARPAQQPEYRELVDRYRSDTVFQEAVQAAAAGAGLRVLYCSAHGLVLLPNDDSPFLLKPAEFRGNVSVEGRTLDGLMQLAIMATVYPRPAELMEPYERGRAPVAVAQVQETLDLIADRLRQAAKTERDPSASAEEEGLLEAWRLYDARPRVGEGRSGRALSHTIAQQITHHLTRLEELGCMLPEPASVVPTWRSTVRYHVLVQEYALSPIADALAQLTGSVTGVPEGGGGTDSSVTATAAGRS
jgi:hypothetical protein